MAWTSSDDVGNPTIYRPPNRATVVGQPYDYKSCQQSRPEQVDLFGTDLNSQHVHLKETASCKPFLGTKEGLIIIH